MTDLEALKARLRETWCGRSGMHDRHEINPDGPEAADAIERLEAENVRLREALRAAYDDTPGWCDTARAALKG